MDYLKVSQLQFYLRDTGCSEVMVKKDLVKEEQLTSKVGYIRLMTVASTLLKAPFANVKVNSLYFNGTVEALCLKDPLYELIMVHISAPRASDNPYETSDLNPIKISEDLFLQRKKLRFLSKFDLNKGHWQILAA